MYYSQSYVPQITLPKPTVHPKRILSSESKYKSDLFIYLIQYSSNIGRNDNLPKYILSSQSPSYSRNNIKYRSCVINYIDL